MRRCTNCDEPVIWLDGMWMHNNGRLFCPIGKPGELLATPPWHPWRPDCTPGPCPVSHDSGSEHICDTDCYEDQHGVEHHSQGTEWGYGRP